MARARNIKPSFFTNDELGELDPLARLLFIGLWTIADFRGCLEYRPKRIKMQILPWDECNLELLAINLERSGFIRFYSVQGVVYLKINNFEKHQNPHKNERAKGGEFPDIHESGSQVTDSKGVAINPDKNGTSLDCDGTNRADSLLLIPDPPKPITDSPKPKSKSTPAAPLDYSSWPSLPDQQILKDWLSHRKQIKAPVSQTVVNSFGKELVIAVDNHFTVDQCLEECMNRGWRGFKADWMVGKVPPKRPGGGSSARDALQEWANSRTGAGVIDGEFSHE